MGGRCNLCAVKNESRGFESGKSLPKSFTAVDYLFHILCLVNGLQAFGRQRKWLNNLPKFMCFCVAFFDVFVSAEDVLDVFSESNRQTASLTAIVLSLNICLYSILTAYVLFTFVTKREPIIELLQVDGRSYMDLVISQAAVTPFIISTIANPSIKCSKILYQKLSLMHMMIVMGGFFSTYIDILRNILRLAEDILRDVQHSNRNATGLLTVKKGRLRGLIQKTNRVFAWILSLYYAQILTSILHCFSQVIESVQSLSYRLILVFALSSFMVQLWYMAGMSSACTSRCQEAEVVFHELVDTTDGVCESCQRKYFRLLKHKEEWDTLKVGCFYLSVPNFVNYLVTCITFVAVILQFDYKVVGTIARLGARGSDNSTNG